MDVLKLPLHTILSTYTEGQLRLIAIFTLVQYHNTKNDMDGDKKGARGKKSFRDMSQAEMEGYYREQGL